MCELLFGKHSVHPVPRLPVLRFGAPSIIGWNGARLADGLNSESPTMQNSELRSQVVCCQTLTHIILKMCETDANVCTSLQAPSPRIKVSQQNSFHLCYSKEAGGFWRDSQYYFSSVYYDWRARRDGKCANFRWWTLSYILKSFLIYLAISISCYWAHSYHEPSFANGRQIEDFGISNSARNWECAHSYHKESAFRGDVWYLYCNCGHVRIDHFGFKCLNFTCCFCNQVEQKCNTSIIDLTKYFHLPINVAGKAIGICPTVLKKICRKHGLQRWPHRKVVPHLNPEVRFTPFWHECMVVANWI